VAAEIDTAIRARLKSGAYDAIVPSAEFADRLGEDLRPSSDDRLLASGSMWQPARGIRRISWASSCRMSAPVAEALSSTTELLSHGVRPQRCVGRKRTR
jgi:hypothetical protein